MDLIDIFLIVLLIIVVILLYLHRKFSYWSRKNVPFMPPKSWIFGSAKDLFFERENSAIVYDEIYRKFENEPLCGFYEFQYPILLVRDPQLIQKVMVENFNSFHDTKFSDALHPDANELLALNPFFVTGNRWKEIRSVLSSSISSNKVRVLEEYIKPIFKKVVTHLESNPNDIEAFELAKLFTSEMVTNFGWGISGGAFSQESQIKKIFNINQFLDSKAATIQYLHPFLGYWLKTKIYTKEFINFFKDMTNQAVSAIENSKSNKGTFLENLLNTREKLKQTGKDMPMKELICHMSTFYLDSYETVARVLSLIIQCLMMYPDVQQRLREEINSVTEEITIETVNRLKYMEMVFLEVYRLNPVAGHYSRICTEPCKLGSLEVDVGTYVVIPGYSIHLDPKYYPDPETFNPENFSEEKKSQQPKFTHFFFGHGPRQCPGQKYASANLRLFVFYLLKNYEILPPSDHPVNPMKYDPSNVVFLVPKGELYVKFKRIL